MIRAAGPVRLTRLDADGQPTGPTTELASISMVTEPEEVECVLAVDVRTLRNYTLQIEVAMTPKQVKAWAPLIYRSRRAYLRHRKYLNKRHGSASKKKNKPGRRGVRAR